MDTFNQRKQGAQQLEEFLDSLEEETADDVPVEEIKEGEIAYRDYLDGRDPGKSLASNS